MTLELPLRGAGGEAVDWLRTVRSHGCVELAPNRVADEGRSLQLPLRLAGGRRVLLRLTATDGGRIVIAVAPRLRGVRVRGEIVVQLRRLLRLDADYAAFYTLASSDPDLAWVARGAGRIVRSPTAFEDVVKTICTTNCSWSATVRMTDALVTLGDPVADGVRLFPTPQQMANAPERWYRDVARAGYRGAYLRALATRVASGDLDLEALADAPPEQLSDDDLESALRALPGVGPYAAAHVMLLMGRASRLVLDSWTRPKYAELSGKKPRSDAAIERRFRRYGRFAGLAFWCYVTSDWLADVNAAAITARTSASVSSSSA